MRPRKKNDAVTKKTLSALTLLTALAVPLVAQAETDTKTKDTKGTKDTEKKGDSITINTSPGGQNAPTTDVTDLSTRNKRDFVADPAGLSFGGTLGLGTQETYGFGVGAKIGYTLPSRVYFGAVGAYHIGNQTEALGNTISNKTWFIGPEAGYDVGVGPVILRPVIGLGLAFRNQSANGPGISNTGNQSDTRLYVSPGASAIYPIGNFFVGGDARLMFTTEDTNLGIYAVGGAHL